MLILITSALQMRMDKITNADGQGSKTYRKAKEHAMRRELLRLQKTSFFESTSSSRGGIYYKCFLKK